MREADTVAVFEGINWFRGGCGSMDVLPNPRLPLAVLCAIGDEPCVAVINELLSRDLLR